MKHQKILFAFVIAISIIIFGCSSSEETSQEKEATGMQQPASEKNDVSSPPAETMNVAKEYPSTQEETGQNTPGQNESSWNSSSSTGKYAVQVGAYQNSERAEEIAASVRQKFSMSVTTFKDKESGFTKILVGNFATKDEARIFRDQIARQYPEEYKDAWVTEVPHE